MRITPLTDELRDLLGIPRQPSPRPVDAYYGGDRRSRLRHRVATLMTASQARVETALGFTGRPRRATPYASHAAYA